MAEESGKLSEIDSARKYINMSFLHISREDIIADALARNVLHVNVGNHFFSSTNINHGNGCPLDVYL
jgi:hypothetical protein